LKLAVSNLAFCKELPFEKIVVELSRMGIAGIELAPTHLAKELNLDLPGSIPLIRSVLNDNDMSFSGMQSLFFGHPELQLFDKRSWPSLLAHLKKMIILAEQLDIHTIVFGSPRNRVKGNLAEKEAAEIAFEFFGSLIPSLAASNVVLTLEPNPSEYGADWLNTYADCVQLTEKINSFWIDAQIDVGCMNLSNEDVLEAIHNHTPRHVHFSVPGLGAIPGTIDFTPIVEALNELDYIGWVTLEMLNSKELTYEMVMHSVKEIVSIIDLGGVA
jgi:D-psicose/D-tagatose/L-ribulose 3-epimerase